MNGKTAWTCSARAFEASRHTGYPWLVRAVLIRTGVGLFWIALALDGRALDVWRELRAQEAEARRRGLERLRDAWESALERVRELVSWGPKGECSVVPAWSLPDSRKIRGLGLGAMWAVLCPYCHEFHTHSPGEGQCTPHCCSSRDPNRYVLEFAGELPLELRARFHRSAKAGLPRLLHQWEPADAGQSELVELLAA